MVRTEGGRKRRTGDWVALDEPLKIEREHRYVAKRRKTAVQVVRPWQYLRSRFTKFANT